jgi:hypothetical protein
MLSITMVITFHPIFLPFKEDPSSKSIGGIMYYVDAIARVR